MKYGQNIFGITSFWHLNGRDVKSCDFA